MLSGRLGNRYEILGLLGGGGTAEVYKAQDIYLNRPVTIKALRPDYASDENFTRLFRREAQAVASLSHANIVSIYDVGQEGNTPYLVMEYVDGENLKHKIEREGPLLPEKAVEILLQVLEALDQAHRNGIVHRDIKSQNILISKNEQAKLTDFGIARVTTSATTTQTGTFMGSMHYISPEQAKGETAGFQSDIYSLGVVLYEMLTGTVPFTGDSPVAVAIKHIQEEPAVPSHLNPSIPAALENITIKAMQKEPALRYGSAAEMAQATWKAYSHRLANTFKPASYSDSPVYVSQPPASGPRDEVDWGKSEKPRAKKPFRTPLFLLILFAVLAAAGFALSSFLNAPGGEVQVPNVVGLPLPEAQKTLDDLGLEVETVRENHASIPEDTVMEQDLKPGITVRLPQVIVLTVSSGPETVDVPSLLEKTLQEARAILEELGLTVQEPVIEEYNEDTAPGLVFDQKPAQGTELPSGSPVTVYVSKGPEHPKVPYLIGLTLEEARTKLQENNLVLDEDVTWAENEKLERGKIMSQEPAPGTEVSRDTAVKVKLSGGPDGGSGTGETVIEIEVPDDGEEHLVEVVVSDERGTYNTYTNTHPAGVTIRVPVRFAGKEASVRILMDGKLFEEKTVSR